MFKRTFLPSLIAVLLATPLSAQQPAATAPSATTPAAAQAGPSPIVGQVPNCV